MIIRHLKHCFFIYAVAALCFSCGTTRSGTTQTKMLADVEPFSIGSVNASFEKLLSSGLTGADVEVIFYPRKNEVALKFKYLTYYYWQFWNEEGRRQFIDALNRYKDDFANQRLTTNNNKSRAVYGKAKGRCEWQTLNLSLAAIYRSSPVLELGYNLKDNTAYFSTYQAEAKEETGANPSGITESRSITMYFTRAQGEELAQLFDQDYLLGLLGDNP